MSGEELRAALQEAIRVAVFNWYAGLGPSDLMDAIGAALRTDAAAAALAAPSTPEPSGSLAEWLRLAVKARFAHKDDRAVREIVLGLIEDGVRAAPSTPEPSELREALERIRAACDASREDIVRDYGTEQRLLFAVIPSWCEAALTAAPSTEPALDVDWMRVATALANTPQNAGDGSIAGFWKVVATEYARLAESQR